MAAELGLVNRSWKEWAPGRSGDQWDVPLGGVDPDGVGLPASANVFSGPGEGFLLKLSAGNPGSLLTVSSFFWLSL